MNMLPQSGRFLARFALFPAPQHGPQSKETAGCSQHPDSYGNCNFTCGQHVGSPVINEFYRTLAWNSPEDLDASQVAGLRCPECDNAENLLVIKGNKPMVDRYIRNFEDLK